MASGVCVCGVVYVIVFVVNFFFELQMNVLTPITFKALIDGFPESFQWDFLIYYLVLRLLVSVFADWKLNAFLIVCGIFFFVTVDSFISSTIISFVVVVVVCLS